MGLALGGGIGVIFDCDGTLVDSMGVWRELEDDLARRAGVDLTRADTDAITAMTIPEVGVLFHERFGLGETPRDVERMIGDFMMDFYAVRSTPKPGAMELVRGLARAGVRQAVASSTPTELLRAGILNCGFAPYMEAVLSVDEVGASKREPAVYDRARQILGTPLASTWGVEDAAYALNTLRAAGYRTLGVYDCDLSGTYEQLACAAEHAIRSLEEVDAGALIRWTGQGAPRS